MIKASGNQLSKRKIFFSFLSGFIILIITWVYQNSVFSRSIEDGFFKKVSLLWKYQLFPDPKYGADFIFINTGKDLALVQDTLDWGNIAVSDRNKIYGLIKLINNAPHKPLFTVLDIQFYYPYSINPQTDTLLELELNKNKQLLIPVVNNSGETYKQPLYPNVPLASSDYKTFSSGFNKFKILNKEGLQSIPVRLHQTVNGAVYKNRRLFASCNGQLCLSAIWPAYYLNNDSVMVTRNETAPQSSGKEKGAGVKKNSVTTQYYNLGELLLAIEGPPENSAAFFKNKIVFIGNFGEDVHSTPVGKMSGPVILANLYLSLLNKQHIISIGFLVLLLIAFSVLSYVAWFSKMPQLKFNEDVFPDYLAKFIQKYITYFGCMFLLSLICLFLFNVPLALFLPSLLFAEIEMRHKTAASLVKGYTFYSKKLQSLKKYFKSFGVKKRVS